MAPDQVPDPGPDTGGAAGVGASTHGAHGARALRTALAFLLLCTAAAHAHWTRPADIIAGLRQDPQLRDKLGVFEVYRDKRLPRLLVVKVLRSVWESAPRETRRTLAQEWHELWRHNVPEGIVAVLDAGNDESVVQFDAFGRARLVERPSPTR